MPKAIYDAGEQATQDYLLGIHRKQVEFYEEVYFAARGVVPDFKFAVCHQIRRGLCYSPEWRRNGSTGRMRRNSRCASDSGPDPIVDGQLVLELADTFLERLLFRGSPPVSIWTKPPGMGKKISIAEFSDKRWETARKKIRTNANAVLRLEAKTADFPNQTIALYAHANPPGGSETIHTGTIAVTCSIPYLRHVSASRDMVDALIAFGVQVWNSHDTRLRIRQSRRHSQAPGPSVRSREGCPADRSSSRLPPNRVHPIPVAATGNDIDLNLDGLIVGGRGIKGAYWANLLERALTCAWRAAHDRLEPSVLPGLRVEPLGRRRI